MTYSPWTGTTASTGDSSYQLGFMNETSVDGAGLPGLRLRKGIDTTWGSWYTLLHAGNYNSYAPALNGTGATGSWGISITGSSASCTGNAATATSATSATTATNWGTYGAVPVAGTSFGNANTIGRSDGNGYTYFNYINSNTGNSENPTISQVIVTNGTDSFYRKASIAHLTSAVQSNASGSWSIDISGSAGSVANFITFNNGGAGNASGTSFSGNAARTISWNTIGALPTPRTTTLSDNGGTYSSLDVSTTDIFVINSLTAAATFNAPTGSPYNGQKIIFRIKDNGTAKTLTFTPGSNGAFRASSDLSLPITTIAGKTLYVGFIYNSIGAGTAGTPQPRWDLLAKLDNF
jgi:hypothetical protein